MIPGTADAASVTLRVNMECLSARTALDGFVMNPELSGGWKPVSVDLFFFFFFLNHTLTQALWLKATSRGNRLPHPS